MASEHAFLRQRLALVERWLANPDREFIRQTRGGFATGRGLWAVRI